MKKISKNIIVVLIICMLLESLFVVKEGKAAGNSYWLTGQDGMSPDKKMKVSWNGNKLFVSGYVTKKKTKYGKGVEKRWGKKSYGISSKCKMQYDNGSESFFEFQKRNGKRGKITGYMEIKIVNRKVVMIAYGA